MHAVRNSSGDLPGFTAGASLYDANTHDRRVDGADPVENAAQVVCPMQLTETAWCRPCYWRSYLDFSSWPWQWRRRLEKDYYDPQLGSWVTRRCYLGF